jgi:hypothetical protein
MSSATRSPRNDGRPSSSEDATLIDAATTSAYECAPEPSITTARVSVARSSHREVRVLIALLYYGRADGTSDTATNRPRRTDRDEPHG